MTTLKEKYDYIMSGPEKNSLDPMDQTPLTRFIKVFDLKDEAIVFQNTVNGVLDTVNGFIGDDNGVDAASDKLDSIPAGGPGYGGSVSSVPTGLLSSVMKIPDYVGKAAAAAFKFIRYNRGLLQDANVNGIIVSLVFPVQATPFPARIPPSQQMLRGASSSMWPTR